ncbi:ATPase family AAA domain-containing protein 5 isoform X2 [Vespa velutina]|uniref:ATPase family AAA domain-containing protein 5 isoform X2 n=1 Tax=Vespa velutina TaxID=202808 RepID=UPI001FB4A193|nr:ATPase family AAA domain-containing protein 5 isoform X2 [Vespa velutina]XP_047346071.1 ATPase family AAA domain-containing protein 5 isoform X2 [Vespa velutina]
MKDLTHYFSDNVKSPTTSKLNIRLKDDSEYSSRKKRTRVKIKISRTNSKSRVCNIVENKSDLIDKTPSPFTKSFEEEKRGPDLDGTPKNTFEVSSSMEPNGGINQEENIGKRKEQIFRKVNLNCILIESDSEPEMLGTKVNNKLSLKKSFDKQMSNEDQMECNLKDYNELKFNTAHRINREKNKEGDTVYEHKESNAFKVLMNQNKPIDDISSVRSLSESDISIDSRKNKSKEKSKCCQDKLLGIEDIKGNNSKRKRDEKKDIDKIEEVSGKRIRLIKENTKKDNISTINREKHTSNNLLHFFSKSSSIGLEEEDKIEVNVSTTIVVKADVHMSEIPTVVHSPVDLKSEIKSDFQRKLRDNKSQTECSTVNKIDLITLEERKLNRSVEHNQRLVQRDKPKWSLRIKMQSPKDKESLSDSGEEGIYSPRSRMKSNAEGRKQFNALNDNTFAVKRYNTYESARSNTERNVKRNKSDKLAGSFNDTTEEDINDDIVIERERKQLRRMKNLERYNSNCNNNEIDINTTDISKELDIIDGHVSEKKPHKKLAPLFIKQSKSNATNVAARRSFLQSDASINNDGKSVEKKVPNYNLICFPFPKISHIRQLNDEIQTNDEAINHKIRLKSNNMIYLPTMNYNDYKYISQSSILSNKSLITINASVEKTTEEILTEMEKHCADTRSMWETVISVAKDHFGMIQLKKGKSKKAKSIEKKGITKDFDERVIANSIWTQKYKPMNSRQIVGNEEGAKKLRDWLSHWRSSLHKEHGSSGDEFYSSDCSFTSKHENNQVAVLLGPHGTGKTATVYAVAEELGYSILEVNASSRRTGKRILKELDEATKSHRIKKNESKSLVAAPILKEANNLPQNSLILLEDIDLIFEEDEGFISATSQLVSNTKRPIVMTCKDVCPHLNKMAPEQNRIYFQKVDGNRASTLLELISLAETGSKISCECLTELLQNGDLRKALLQLQYLLVSGFTHATKYSFNSRRILWQDMRYYIYQPAIKENKKQKAKGRLTNKNTNILINLADHLDNLSLLPSLIEINDPALDIVCNKLQPSLSLTEDTASYSALQHLSTEIGEWIDQEIIQKNHLIGKNHGIQYKDTFSLKKQLNKGVDSALSPITSYTLDNRSVSLDYLPCVRTICRTEECRTLSSIKRGNRFFHYLSGLKLPASSVKPNILTAACKMLQEKS